MSYAIRKSYMVILLIVARICNLIAILPQFKRSSRSYIFYECSRNSYIAIRNIKLIIAIYGNIIVTLILYADGTQTIVGIRSCFDSQRCTNFNSITACDCYSCILNNECTIRRSCNCYCLRNNRFICQIKCNTGKTCLIIFTTNNTNRIYSFRKI